MNVERCCKQVFRTGWGGNNCTRKGTVEVNGKWYCWQHDPERVKREDKKRYQEWKDKNDASNAVWHRRTLEREVCQDVSTEEIEKLGAGGLLRMLLYEYRR